MWEPYIIEKAEGFVKYQIQDFQGKLSYRNWIESLKHSEDFIKFFNDILKNNSFRAFFWEVKPISKDQLDSAFEFVIVESTTLSRIQTDSTPFQKYFSDGKEVVSFPNLGGDAQLIVPTDLKKTVTYPHIAEFVRNAPVSQAINFWKTVGHQFGNHIDKLPKWLSTAGLGVYWLHIRIDSRPKYYRHNPYKIHSQD